MYMCTLGIKERTMDDMSSLRTGLVTGVCVCARASDQGSRCILGYILSSSPLVTVFAVVDVAKLSWPKGKIR